MRFIRFWGPNMSNTPLGKKNVEKYKVINFSAGSAPQLLKIQ